MEVGATGSPGTRAPKLVEEESNSERANALILPRLMEADNAMDHFTQSRDCNKEQCAGKPIRARLRERHVKREK